MRRTNEDDWRDVSETDVVGVFFFQKREGKKKADSAFKDARPAPLIMRFFFFSEQHFPDELKSWFVFGFQNKKK